MVKNSSDRFYQMTQFRRSNKIRTYTCTQLPIHKLTTRFMFEYNTLKWVTKRLTARTDIMHISSHKKYNYIISINYRSDLNEHLSGSYWLSVIDRHNKEIYKKSLLPFELDDDIVKPKDLLNLSQKVKVEVE